MRFAVIFQFQNICSKFLREILDKAFNAGMRVFEVPQLRGRHLQLGFQTESWFPGRALASLECRSHPRLLPRHLHHPSGPL